MSNDLALPEAVTQHRKPGPKLTEADRRSVVAHYMTSGSITATAQAFNLSRNTVAGLVNSVRDAPITPLSTQWRAPMLQKAVQGVNAGLDCVDDPYKRANIGVQVLKGLGEFNADSQVNVAALVTSWPAELAQPSQIEDQTPPPIDIDAPLLGQ